jgi:hypothetical protein
MAETNAEVDPEAEAARQGNKQQSDIFILPSSRPSITSTRSPRQRPPIFKSKVNALGRSVAGTDICASSSSGWWCLILGGEMFKNPEIPQEPPHYETPKLYF